jgi:peptidoglycan-N-acetylglucosamine deacetylase
MPSLAGSDPLGADRPVGPMKLAITMDDLPGEGDVIAMNRADAADAILKAFKDNGVEQVYGMANGWEIDIHPKEIEILKEWLKAGYPLGNHTYHHTSLDKVSADTYNADIGKMDQYLQTLAPVSPLIARRYVFRYPFLEEGSPLQKRDAVRNYLAKNGYAIAEVTVDTLDWAWTDAYNRCSAQDDEKSMTWLTEHEVDNVERHLRGARIIANHLFHRPVPQIMLIHAGVIEAVTLDALLKDLHSKGVQFVTLEEALKDPIYSINPNLAYEGGQTFLDQIANARNVNVDPFRDTMYTVEKINAVCK